MISWLDDAKDVKSLQCARSNTAPRLQAKVQTQYWFKLWCQRTDYFNRACSLSSKPDHLMHRGSVMCYPSSGWGKYDLRWPARTRGCRRWVKVFSRLLPPQEVSRGKYSCKVWVYWTRQHSTQTCHSIVEDRVCETCKTIDSIPKWRP